MTIAIHISPADDPYGFVFDAFRWDANRNPSDHYLFILDKPLARMPELPANCTPVTLPPEIKNSLTRHYWYNYKIPATLNRYQADVFFTSREICSLQTTVPQIMLLNAAAPRTGGYREAFRKKYAKKAAAAGVFEREIFSKVSRWHPGLKEKTKYLGHGLRQEWVVPGEKEVSPGVAAVINEGPYFVSVINRHNAAESVNLLKAFSIFKKWQRSSYRIVLINLAGASENVVPNFSSYKYRDAVMIVNNPSLVDLCSIMAGAFCCIQLFHPSLGMRQELEAMYKGVPVISTCPENERAAYLGSSALYATKTDAGIAEQMMRLYKDENLYRELSVKALEIAREYNWEKTAQTLHDMAVEAVAQTP